MLRFEIIGVNSQSQKNMGKIIISTQNKGYNHVGDIIYVLVCLKRDEHVDDTQTKD